MLIKLNTKVAACMYDHYSQEKVEEMMRKNIADQASKQIIELIMKSDWLKLQSRLTNNREEDGCEYQGCFVILNDEESSAYMKQMNIKLKNNK